MRLIHRLLGFVPLLVACGVIVLLERRFSLGVAVTIFVSAVILATLAGAMLLRSSAVGQSSWRKGLASKLLPWGWIGEYGSMLRLCLSNLLGSILFGFACFGVARYLRHNDYALERVGGWTIACGLAWIVLIGMVL